MANRFIQQSTRMRLAAMDRETEDWSGHYGPNALSAVATSTGMPKVAKGGDNPFAAFTQPDKKGGFGAGGPQEHAKREIPPDHEFNPKSLKPLSKMLWALSVSLGHAMTANREFSRLKSVSFSPDGKVGGRGYVMTVKQIRNDLFQAADLISAVCDTIHDEIHAPHWKPKLADLEKKDLDEVENLLGEAEDNLEDPEGETEEDFEEALKADSTSGKDRFQKHEQKVPDDEPGSKLPGGPNIMHAPTVREQTTKQASIGPRPPFAAGIRKLASSLAQPVVGVSSVPPHSLPGPRVDHSGDRGSLTGPGGSYNKDEPPGQWPQGQRPYDYPSPWDNNLSGDKLGESKIPNAVSDPTPTEGFDFGIGFGDAKGQGAKHSPRNPDTGDYGVDGPRAQLPRDPGGKMQGDNPALNTTLYVEQATKDMGIPKAAQDLVALGVWPVPAAPDQSVLPNDYQMPVARADYYRGLKDNDFNGTPHGSTSLPGDGTTVQQNRDRGLVDTGHTMNRRDPVVKYDYGTTNMRPDDLYTIGPIEGPFVKRA